MSVAVQPTTTPDNAGTGNAPGATTPTATPEPQSGATAVTFTQEQLDEIIKKRLAQQKRKLGEQADAAQQKATDAAETTRLQEQKQFKELSEKQAARLAELEKLEPRLKSYEQAFGIYLEKAREGLPEHLAPLLDKLNPVEQLEYLTEHGAALAKPAGGVPPTPNTDPKQGQLTPEERRKRSANARHLF